MPTRLHEKEDERETTINFRCDGEWKRLVASSVALKGETIQSVGIKAISQYLGIPAPGIGTPTTPKRPTA